MKIKADDIQPGMVIGVDNEEGTFRSVYLITATGASGLKEFNFTGLDLQQAYGGLLGGSLDSNKKVKVYKGKNRTHIIESMKKDVFRNLRDIEYLIDTIRLIEVMSP